MPEPRRYRSLLPAYMLAALIAVPCHASADDQGPIAVVVSTDGKTLYVAAADARQVVWVDCDVAAPTRRVDLPGEPTGLALHPDGKRLVVTCANPRSTVLLLDVESGETLATLSTGHTSGAPAITPDGKRLYVCNRFDNDVSVIDLETERELTRVAVEREPIAAAVTPDGSTLLVVNFLPNTRTDPRFIGDVAPVVTFIDTTSHATSTVTLASGSIDARGLCISPDGRYAYVAHILCNFELVPMQLDMGWINNNVLGVIDIAEKKLINTVGLDDMYTGAGNPWGVACSADGGRIFITHAGSHELSIVDARSVLEKLFPMLTSPVVGMIEADRKQGILPPRRIAVSGKGPRGLAVVGSKVYMAEYFSDTLGVVDVGEDPSDGDEDSKPTAIRLGPPPEWNQQRWGEFLFHDASICYQQWQSCSSCHPDGRTDVLNWDLMNDGTGNFKNTKSLLLTFETPPVMAEGVRPDARTAVRAGIEHILFTLRPEEEAAAIDAYIQSLEPVPSPRLVDGSLSPKAVLGGELFESPGVGCSKCHPKPLYTDLKSHAVGSRGPYEYVDSYDTPTLVEIWRTAPYLHDGRYVTIKELLIDGKHGNTRGGAEHLGAEDLEALIEYVLSL